MIFLHRITESPSDDQTIPVDYFGSDANTAKDGDTAVLYMAGEFTLFGIYTLKEKQFICKEKAQDKTMRDILGKLSFVQEVTDTTIRMLKKKNREITADDLHIITEYIHSSSFSAPKKSES
jgi:hypothetical protein